MLTVISKCKNPSMLKKLLLRHAKCQITKLKTQLIQLCKDNGLPTGGLKSSLIARLLTLRSQLPPLPASSAVTANAGSQQAVRFAQTASTGRPATQAVSAIAASPSAGVLRLPAASTHAGPGLQPSNLHMMAQQDTQQAAARVLTHFALPSAPASSTAFAPAPPLFRQLPLYLYRSPLPLGPRCTPAPGPGATTASPHPTLPLIALFFPLVGQPRKPGSLWQAQNSPQRPRQRRSAAITTGGGAPGATALAVTCASPPAVMGHTRSPPAPPRDLPLGSSDLSEDSPLSTPPPSPPPLPTLFPPSDLTTEPTFPLDPPTSRSQPLTLPLQHLPPLPPLPPHCPIPPTHTPVNSPLLASLLTGHPNSDFTTYLLQGFGIQGWIHRPTLSTPFLQSALSPGSVTSYRQILGGRMSSRVHSTLPLYPTLLSTNSVLFPRKDRGNGASLCTFPTHQGAVSTTAFTTMTSRCAIPQSTTP